MYCVWYVPRPLQSVLSEAWVAPINQLGLVELPCRTHLGHILSPGDVVWGFPLSSANLNDPNLDKMKPEAIPDVVSGGCAGVVSGGCGGVVGGGCGDVMGGGCGDVVGGGCAGVVGGECADVVSGGG